MTIGMASSNAVAADNITEHGSLETKSRGRSATVAIGSALVGEVTIVPLRVPGAP